MDVFHGKNGSSQDLWDSHDDYMYSGYTCAYIYCIYILYSPINICISFSHIHIYILIYMGGL